MSGQRHVACRLCRERKVKCSGESEACDQCRRSGERCVYMPTYRPSKVELADTVELMQQRLEKTESLLRQLDSTQPSPTLTPAVQTSSIGSSVDSETSPRPDSISNGLFRQHQGGDFSADLTSDFFNSAYPARNRIGNGSVSAPAQGDDFFSYPVTACSPIGNGPLPFQPPHGANFPVDLPGDFFSVPRPGRTRSGTDLLSLQALEALSGGGGGGGGRAQDEHRVWMPSLRELRGLTATSLAQDAAEPDGGGGSAATAFLPELSAFSATIFTTQAEVAGVSPAVAEYLAWMSKEPQPPANLARMLQVLEARAREVHEMARTRHWAAWRAMAAALEKHEGLGPGLRGLEEDLFRREAEVESFFEAGYSAGRSLDCQHAP